MGADEKSLRMAIIAGAAKAAQYMQKNRHATESDVIKHISDNLDQILENIDNPL